MPLEAVKVPQNVYVEDRIVGPITLRHLLILGVGAGISYMIWAIASSGGPLPLPVTILCWTPLGIAAAFSFVKINDISLFKIILLMLERANKPNQRTWGQHAGISINFITKSPKSIEDPNAPKIVREVSRLAELSRELEESKKGVEALTMESRMDDAALAHEGDETEQKEHERAFFPVERSRITADGERRPSVDGIAPRNPSPPSLS